MRFGRVTASTIHEASHCKTAEGALVCKIIGAAKAYDNVFMKRGRALEKFVLRILASKLKLEIKKCGIILIPELVVIGASADGLGDDFVVEIKCPSSKKTTSYYIKGGEICEKFKAQIDLQMFAAKKKRGLFCAADPNFEENGEFKYLWIEYDENYTRALIKRARAFWLEKILPVISKPYAAL
ncbi:hypothetical protein QAD02_013603 [Eretmocerus hayati]|uniref:Uncharacterized protein n=1 Tax=Eretmocerus hayati TaxID=131215 RepID=A0ACC2P4R4_9HYME|nr:hypothetical protein QAD02_013603 [Eretmocerus hayati]